MLRNIIGPIFNFKNCVFVVFCLFFKNPLLYAGRMRFSKIKKQKKTKNGPAFNFTKGKSWTSF